ncbi:MAG TPA: SGNH/GDSL hydrolase family protein, partial [Longimicrobiales bacterium]|nr:SGNH/GDSL hydrolase family protein [Longimicrobiales bacterium]
GLGLVEMLLRLQEPYFHLMGARAESTLERYAPHRVWHHWLRPHNTVGVQSFNDKLWPRPMIWKTNAQGCRYGRDLSRRPPKGARRIIVMGDSFTEGYYQDSGIAATLERRLYQAGGPILHEVINCGTSSYSPVLYYLRYKHHLSKFHPDELIVNIDLTDVYDDNVRYGPNLRYAAGGEPIEALPTARGLNRMVTSLKYRFHFARLIFGNPARLVAPTRDEIFAYHSRLTPDSARWQRAVGVSLGHLQRLIDLTRSQGVELTLTMYPYLIQVVGPASGPPWHRGFENEVRKLAERNGIAFYSAYDDILPHVKRGEPVYWVNDFHFTPTGQDLWSSVFADYYMNRKRSSGHEQTAE